MPRRTKRQRRAAVGAPLWSLASPHGPTCVHVSLHRPPAPAPCPARPWPPGATPTPRAPPSQCLPALAAPGARRWRVCDEPARPRQCCGVPAPAGSHLASRPQTAAPAQTSCRAGRGRCGRLGPSQGSRQVFGWCWCWCMYTCGPTPGVGALGSAWGARAPGRGRGERRPAVRATPAHRCAGRECNQLTIALRRHPSSREDAARLGAAPGPPAGLSRPVGTFGRLSAPQRCHTCARA
jgi:hypothetical protein